MPCLRDMVNSLRCGERVSGPNAVVQIRGTKFEIRNKSEVPNDTCQPSDVCRLGFRASSLFRISNFVFRIYPLAGHTAPRSSFSARMEGFVHRGIIEGFYGPPYSHADRLWLIDKLGAWGLNRYVYAPKDDPLHRVL